VQAKIPHFLESAFEWSERDRKLTIKAVTVELATSLIVRGYLGVERSIFVGGDPSYGSPSTEVG
jgi:hypothetical protein